MSGAKGKSACTGRRRLRVWASPRPGDLADQRATGVAFSGVLLRLGLKRHNPRVSASDDPVSHGADCPPVTRSNPLRNVAQRSSWMDLR